MAGQPWFKFFAGDWLSDGKLRMCRAEGIAVWIQALTYMHKEETCSISGENIEIAMALNLPESQVEEGIRQLEKYDVCEVERDSHGGVTLTSRRLSREEEERAAARDRKRRQREREKKEKEGVTDESRIHMRGHALTSDSDSIDKPSVIEKEETGEDRLKDTGAPDYEAVEDSWNEFAEETGLPQIRKMTKKRKAAVRSKYDEVWPHIEEIYERIRGSPFLLGEGGRDSWRGANFDFLWLREDNYTRILEGAYSGKAAGRSDRHNGALHGPGTGSGEEVPGGISERIRRSLEGKRDGELSDFEYAIACGWDLEEVGGLARPRDIARHGLPAGVQNYGVRVPAGHFPDRADDGAQGGEGPPEEDRGSAGEG